MTVLASTLVSAPWSQGAALAAPTGLPLFEFVNSGTGPLPWNAVSLERSINHTTMLGAPHSTSNATEGVIAYRTNADHLATYTQLLGSTTPPSTKSSMPTSKTPPQWMDYSVQNDVPTPAADPVPFFDPSGNVDLLFVDSLGHLILFTANDPVSAKWLHTHHQRAWRPYVATDLSNLTHAIAANGLASVQLSGPNATIAFRTAQNNIEVFTLTFEPNETIPFLSGTPSTVSSLLKPTNSTPPPTTSMTTSTATSTTTSRATTTTTTPVNSTATTTTTVKPTTTTTVKPTTTTTKPPVTTTTSPPTTPAFASDPIVLPGILPSFAALSNRGDLEVFTNVGGTTNTWNMLDVTTLTGAPKVTGTLTMGFNQTTLYFAATTSVGSVQLFSTPVPSQVFTGHVSASPPVWTVLNVTTTARGAPPLGGSLFLGASATEITIAGQAANWGDLFALTTTIGSPTWNATDVSVTGGSAAQTVGGAVTGTQIGSTLTLFAAGVNSPPPQGVGVYAIPSSKWGQAITDRWPIISETGGLGTRSAPWTGFTSTSNVANSPDFLMGQSIYNSHKRVTWLSFWTVSGPVSPEPHNAAAMYKHGFAAGQWVATQIDQYRALGVGLKPDWVILDPEGYPDNHSGLDASGGASSGVLAEYGNFWAQMLLGWATGINSVDPSLNPGVYASQSEYRNYNLSTLPLPVFVALAFGYGGPVPVPGASGSNIRGFITFNATCTPTSSLKSQESTLLNPPWGGQFNTLQFNAGVYCPPA